MKYKLPILSILFIFLLSGCATLEPYNTKLSIVDDSLSLEEKRMLLNRIIERKSFSTPYEYKYFGCLNKTIYWNSGNRGWKYSGTLNNCFNIYSNNTIVRSDYTDSRIYSKGGQISDNYIEFINKFQLEIEKEFYEEVSKYKKYLTYFDEASLNREKLYTNVSVFLKDNTKVLPKKILKDFDKPTIELPKKNKIHVYKNNYFSVESAKDLDEDFTIRSMLSKKQIGRYRIKLKENYYEYPASKFPKNLALEIDKVFFSYIPKNFYFNDKNINVRVKNVFKKVMLDYSYVGKDDLKIDSILIENKTNKFIEIDTIASYYGQNVDDNILRSYVKLKIPPKSSKTISSSDINNSHDGFFLVDNKKDKVNYGFSVEYRIADKTLANNLYYTKKYSTNDF